MERGENKEGSTREIYIIICAFVLERNASIGFVCLFFSTGNSFEETLDKN